MAPPPAPGVSIAGLNQAAVAAAQAGDHEGALAFYAQALAHAAANHLSHPQLFITHSNKAASHLALGQHEHALLDAKRCLELLGGAPSAGLSGPARHPHWPKACLRLGRALDGLGQHKQAAAAFEAGLAADPFNPALRAGLQTAQQGCARDALAGTAALLHFKALPAPETPQRITLLPHSAPRAATSSSSSSRRRGHKVGWQTDGRDQATALLAAAAAVADSSAALPSAPAPAGTSDGSSAPVQLLVASEWEGLSAAASDQLPRQLLTPAAVLADSGLRDVFEYLSTQCAIRAPKYHLLRVLPDAARMSAWWAATTAAVQAVRDSGRSPRVLLLGAKAGVLAVAALRAGADHVTCVESCPYLAAASRQVLLDNGVPAHAFSTICSPLGSSTATSLRLGPVEGRDVPSVCNTLVADLVDDGVLSGGLMPAVAHVLDELLVREDPVIVPRVVTVMAQAVGLRPTTMAATATAAPLAGSDAADGPGSSARLAGRTVLDLTALDCYRWTASQALPAPLDCTLLLPLSDPLRVWHLPTADMTADRSATQYLDVELVEHGSWCAVAFWAELQLFGDITLSAGAVMPRRAAAAAPQQEQLASSSASPDSGSNIGGAAPPSNQPALCWLPGALTVAPGQVYPLAASHNTVRLAFTLQEADYSFLFHREPSFPHTAFGMAADQGRLDAYAAALTATLNRAAKDKRAAQEPCSSSSSGVTPAWQQQETAEVDLTVLDVGCGCGVLSLLAAAAGASLAPSSSSSSASSPGTEAVALPPAAQSVRTSVVGVEMVAPLAAAARRAVAANGAAGSVSIVHGDAASLQRGVQLPLAGADVIVLDVFDAGLIGHGVLGLLEAVKARAAAAGCHIIPATATLYCMGLELLTADSWPAAPSAAATATATAAAGRGGRVQLDLSALDAYRWSDAPDTVALHQLPYRPCTAPARLGDFDFCTPAGSSGGYPADLSVTLRATAASRLNSLALWFHLHLAEGVSITSAPLGFTTGGRPSEATQPGATAAAGWQQQQQEHHWGQALIHMEAVADVLPGDELTIAASRSGPQMHCALTAATRGSAAEATPLPLLAAPRPPWLRAGAGIEDAAVWTVKKCEQLRAQMLMRAPGAKFPPIWQDLALMQVHAGSLGLDAAVVAAVTQELAMREALSVASARQVVVSPLATAEAAGLQPPVSWR